MEQVDVLLDPVRTFLTQIAAYAPRVAVAILILIGGWLLAKALRFAVERGLRAVNFNVLTERAGLDAFLAQGGVRTDTTGLFGLLAYWLVILATLVVAFNGLGLTYITDLIGRVLVFVPRVMVALLILVFGAYFARFVATSVIVYCRNAGIHDAEFLGRAAQYAILGFVTLIALDQVGVGGEIVRATFLIVLAGVVLALALAFGLGGREWAAHWLERWWPHKDTDRTE